MIKKRRTVISLSESVQLCNVSAADGRIRLTGMKKTEDRLLPLRTSSDHEDAEVFENKALIPGGLLYSFGTKKRAGVIITVWFSKALGRAQSLNDVIIFIQHSAGSRPLYF